MFRHVWRATPAPSFSEIIIFLVDLVSSRITNCVDSGISSSSKSTNLKQGEGKELEKQGLENQHSEEFLYKIEIFGEDLSNIAISF